MSLTKWAELHGEDYPAKIQREAPKRPLTKKDLEFCLDEILGELGWCDEIAETGVDFLDYARDEIKGLRRHIKRLEKSLELRDAANGKCKQCGTLHAETIIHCDVCGAFQ